MTAPSLSIGLDLYPTRTAWSEMRAVVEAADELGYDSLWTWDHLYGFDDPSCPIFEGWTTIAAWAAVTTGPTLGLLVTANTFRNPGLLAKMAVTVDHVSGGRCVLGIGAGWRPREHVSHGIEFGNDAGDRFARLDEALGVIRALLAGSTISSSASGAYTFRDAHQEPPPARGQGRLPILVGAAGERVGLRVAARHADMWHPRYSGTPQALGRKRDVLASHCRDEGRDPSTIEHLYGTYVVIRDDPGEAEKVLRAALAANREEFDDVAGTAWLGPPERIAEHWAPFVDLGFRNLIVELPAPYDRATVERMPDVRRLLAGSNGGV